MRSRSVGSPDATRGGGLGAADRLPTPAPRSDRPREVRARSVGPRRLLLFDPNNIRYVTSTHIGEWARDKNARFALLPRGSDPILWDFGSAARHHQLFAPWLPPENFRAGVAPMRGAMPVETGIPDRLGERIAHEFSERDLQGEPLGVDMADLVTIEALQPCGRTSDGRVARAAGGTQAEDGAGDRPARSVRRACRRGLRGDLPDAAPGRLRARDRRARPSAPVRDGLGAGRGDQCGLGRPLQSAPSRLLGPLLRPGDQAFFDIIHSFMGYRTCYYRTFNVGGVNSAQLDAYKQCREWLDAAIELVRPGMTTDRIAEVWPTAEELGFPDEETCFGLQFGHGIGVGLYEPPMISRVHSLDHPVELEEGMVFALETYCAATDGRSAARIEEEVVVTATGCEVITRFPAEELLVAGRIYVRGADLLSDGRRCGQRDGIGAVAAAAFVGRRDVAATPAPASSRTAGPATGSSAARTSSSGRAARAVERPANLPSRGRGVRLDAHGADARVLSGGHVDEHLHSFETSFYVLEGDPCSTWEDAGSARAARLRLHSGRDAACVSELRDCAVARDGRAEASCGRERHLLPRAGARRRT